jgi:hypothetical protein
VGRAQFPLVARTPSILAVNPALLAKSVKDLIALAKASPGKIDSAGGTGTTMQTDLKLFKAMAGASPQWSHVRGMPSPKPLLAVAEPQYGLEVLLLRCRQRRDVSCFTPGWSTVTSCWREGFGVNQPEASPRRSQKGCRLMRKCPYPSHFLRFALPRADKARSPPGPFVPSPSSARTGSRPGLSCRSQLSAGAGLQ